MDCLPVTDQKYMDFSSELYEKCRPQRVPLNGSIEVTMRCNLRCKHCYIPMAKRTSANQNELSRDEFHRIFDEIAEAGCMWLLLTGGEPFLRPDFLDIYDDAKRHGFIISVFTNGTLLTPRIVDHLKEYRPFAVEITLYGATQTTYERVTGVPGSFRRCMHGIELLLKAGIHLELKTILLTLNYQELYQMKALSKKFGSELRFDPIINAQINGDLTPIKYRLTPGQIIDIEAGEEKLVSAWLNNHRNNLNVEFNRDKMYNCNAGRSGFHMDAFGRVSLCLSAREPSYDLRKGTFSECWNKFIPNILEQEYKTDLECRDCPLRAVCPQCPGVAMSECHNPETKVPFLCELAHLRYNNFYQELGLL